ncbi:unnamed protein product [Dicrocoelium dendriticum]|nr:unnamed protein product [Dicrocoelium dendriticum]
MKVTLQLPFKGDDVCQAFQRRLKSAVARVYPAAEPVLIYTTNRIPTPSVKPPLSLSSRLHILYQFTCICKAEYVGMTERHLRVRITEHIPAWVSKNVSQMTTSTTLNAQPRKRNEVPYKQPASSIARHLLADNHCVDPVRAFRVIYTSMNPLTLRYAEAVAIKQLGPTLCVQKDAFVTLALPW